MYCTIYKITNRINGKFYIGCHQTNDLNDDYMGSGIGIKRAFKKYGIKNFEKEILFVFDNPQDMWDKEKEIVELGEHSYNMSLGGRGGWSHVDNRGDNNPMRHPTNVKRCVESHRKNGSYSTPARQEHQKEITKKAAKRNRGRKRPKHSKFMSEWAHKYWEENKESMRDALSSWFLVISPGGEKYKTNRLEDFCKERNLPYTTIWGYSKRPGQIIKRGRAKGWKCQRIS